jgi:D-hexose-6-phosphate mutarotase
MVSRNIPAQLRRLEIPGKLTFLEGNGELTKIEATSDHSSAEIYLYGAHVTDFRKPGEAPVLFTSPCSRFKEGQPIRGGIPIIFPWFGAREGEPMHGFARISDWHLHEATAVPEGGVSLRFGLPETAESGIWPPFTANYVVTVTETLKLELTVTNTALESEFNFEDCFHTYVAVSDISAVSIIGLEGTPYLDKVDNFARKIESKEPLRINSEVDRVYLDATNTVEILDPTLARKIRLVKRGSRSTIVWNPWKIKTQEIPDLGEDEYQRMVCVESGNVGQNKITLQPGKSAVLALEIITEPLN